MTKLNNSYNVCGGNLRRIRKELKLSQSDLARKAQLEGLNIDKKTISLIENGKRGFQDFEVICCARALGASISELMENDLPKQGSPENQTEE